MFSRRCFFACVGVALGALVLQAVADHKGKPHGKPGGDPPGGGDPTIAYSRVREQRSGFKRKLEYALMVMEADGSSKTVVLKQDSDLDGTTLGAPSWSPDGTKIAFAQGHVDSGIYTVRSDGTDLLQVVQGPADSPAWSPDGTEIAYVADDDVRVIEIDGTNDRNLTNTAGQKESSPTWSPDGTRIAYVAKVVGSPQRDVLVHDLGTGATTNVTAGGPLSGLLMSSLDWARTQDKLAVSVSTEAYACPGEPNNITCFVRDVWIIDLSDPLSPFNLTNTPQDNPGIAFAEWSPSWSPDDSQLVFERNRDLFVINADGTGETRIAEASPPGKWDFEGLFGTDWKR